MKILFTSKGRDWDSMLDQHFGRAEGFLLYDTDNDQINWYSNADNKSQAHGAGIQAAKKAADLKADILITGHVGPKADATLKSSGIKVFPIDTECTVREAYEKYKSASEPENR